MRCLRLIPIGVLGALLASGCASSGAARGPTALPPLQAAALQKFGDVPVPVGFQLLDNESFAFQNEMTRVGLLKYVGRPVVDRVVQFYREQMAQYGWNFLNLLEYESHILNFEKADQTCIVTVGKRGDRTQVTIAVAPKSNASRVLRKSPSTASPP